MHNATAFQQQLAAAGSERYRTMHRRRGVRSDVYGVNAAPLAKKITTDQGLANAQRERGSHTARVLVTMIAEPRRIALRNCTAPTAAAKRIDQVRADHNDTGRATPDAVPDIEKVWPRKAER